VQVEKLFALLERLHQENEAQQRELAVALQRGQQGVASYMHQQEVGRCGAGPRNGGQAGPCRAVPAPWACLFPSQRMPCPFLQVRKLQRQLAARDKAVQELRQQLRLVAEQGIRPHKSPEPLAGRPPAGVRGSPSPTRNSASPARNSRTPQRDSRTPQRDSRTPQERGSTSPQRGSRWAAVPGADTPAGTSLLDRTREMLDASLSPRPSPATSGPPRGSGGAAAPGAGSPLVRRRGAGLIAEYDLLGSCSPAAGQLPGQAGAAGPGTGGGGLLAAAAGQLPGRRYSLSAAAAVAACAAPGAGPALTVLGRGATPPRRAKTPGSAPGSASKARPEWK
jgi:hypothetical protein